MALNGNGLRDVVPQLDHYRLNRRMKRPSLSTLYEENHIIDIEIGRPEIANVADQEVHAVHGIKLGWIQDVLISCLLNIGSVMLFLQLSWVIAQAGILQSIIIFGLSAVICVITTLTLQIQMPFLCILGVLFTVDAFYTFYYV